jgi:hypothetical protein
MIQAFLGTLAALAVWSIVPRILAHLADRPYQPPKPRKPSRVAEVFVWLFTIVLVGGFLLSLLAR